MRFFMHPRLSIKLAGACVFLTLFKRFYFSLFPMSDDQIILNTRKGIYLQIEVTS